MFLHVRLFLFFQCCRFDLYPTLSATPTRTSAPLRSHWLAVFWSKFTLRPLLFLLMVKVLFSSIFSVPFFRNNFPGPLHFRPPRRCRSSFFPPPFALLFFRVLWVFGDTLEIHFLHRDSLGLLTWFFFFLPSRSDLAPPFSLFPFIRPYSSPFFLGISVLASFSGFLSPHTCFPPFLERGFCIFFFLVFLSSKRVFLVSPDLRTFSSNRQSCFLLFFVWLLLFFFYV